MVVARKNRPPERQGRWLGAAATLAAALLALALVSPALAGSGGPGDLDRSFGDGGLLTVKGAHDYPGAVAIGRKGRIVVAGVHTVARRMPGGRPDRSFGKRGLVRLDSGAYAGHNSFVARGSSAVAVGPQGAVYVAGAACSERPSFSCDYAVSRLTKTGALDQSFGQGGTARIGFEKPVSRAMSIAITAGGRLVVGGTTCDGHCEFALARLDRNGELDPSFGSGGKVVSSSGGGCDFPFQGMALDSGDRIVLARLCDAHVVSVARFTPSGRPDRSFGNGGRVTRRVPIQSVNAITVDSHDRMDLAGRYFGRPGVVRFGRDGRFDSSFGYKGVARPAHLTRLGFTDPTSVALDSRDRIVVAARALRPRGLSFARFEPDGHVNHRFGHDGTRLVGRKRGFREASSVAIDRRDRIVGAGRVRQHGHPHFALARLLG
jgi:uncharacterized delta-60 repeat protein